MINPNRFDHRNINRHLSYYEYQCGYVQHHLSWVKLFKVDISLAILTLYCDCQRYYLALILMSEQDRPNVLYWLYLSLLVLEYKIIDTKVSEYVISR